MIKKINKLDGRHWESGSVQNALALQGIKAPHTGEPFSEAFLLGVSGGIAFGYFTFEYKGHLPHVAILTRNTFDPFQTMLERLGCIQHVFQTTKSGIAEKNLMQALSAGGPAIVWADECSLPYNNKQGAAYWNMIPVVVFGMDGDDLLVADRSSKPFRVSMDVLTRARARVKDDKFRLITLEVPVTSKLASAVQKGIWQCISLFTDKPPRGTRENFGFAAYQKLADMLVNTRNKQSWQRLFSPGPKMYNALAGMVEGSGGFAPPGMFTWVNFFGAGDGAERSVYADFLDEAAIFLEKKPIKEAAKLFRLSHAKWIEFADACLSSRIPAFKESKTLMVRKHRLFMEQGGEAVDEIKEINSALKKIEAQMMREFPLTPEQVVEFREGLREHVLIISGIEQKAIEILQAGMK